MKAWYRLREVSTMVDFFNRAIESGDALSAGAMFGLLYDILEISKMYSDTREDSYSWKRLAEYIGDELDKIEKAAKDYPITIQQALIAKVILYRQGKSV